MVPKDPEDALDDLKFDVAEDVDVPLEEEGQNGDLTARQLGRIGGQMVKRLVAKGKESLADEGEDAST